MPELTIEELEVICPAPAYFLSESGGEHDIANDLYDRFQDSLIVERAVLALEKQTPTDSTP